ncbi:hypothetical protein DRE_03909 [Drechslerella stenobrocha 248]|uniref:Kelch repeat-containing protein n=1 Tax=Drechslerella stenobrocha 248 TaxID=1043628 RepID=W7I3C6_9PEZI|nr:hypothetical protein DRE_03909 [Drechslerella stenobrocha 248]
MVRQSTKNPTASALPQFFSLDISQSFTTNNPKFEAIATPSTGGPPNVENATLWYDQVRNRVLLYGGAFQNTSGDVDTAPQAIWSYDLVQGQWSAVTTAGGMVTRAAFGASTFVDDVGYYRGGQQDAYTTPDYPQPSSYTLLSGLRTFNMTSKEFNEVTTGFEVFGDPISEGYRQGTLVPIELSGRKYLINYGGGGKIGVGLPLKNIYVYDIQAQKWYIQPVDGEAPGNVRGACAVAAYAADGSSVNIYNYGGIVYDNEAGRFTQSRQLSILSIPAFKWIFVDKSDSLQPGGLQDHTCHLQGANMLIIGGRDFSSGCDINPVKVFNMSTLKWQSDFSAYPSEYQVPYEIFSQIGGNSSGFSNWDNKPFQDPPDASSPLFSIRGADAPTTSTNRDAIIAGSAIGAISIIGIIVALVLLYYNRKRQVRQRKEDAQNFYNEVFASAGLAQPVLRSPTGTSAPTDAGTIVSPAPISPVSPRKFWSSLRRTPSTAMPNIPRRPTERRREELSMLDTTTGFRGDRDSIAKESIHEISPAHERERVMAQIYPSIAELPAESISSDEMIPGCQLEVDMLSEGVGVIAELEPRPQGKVSVQESTN